MTLLESGSDATHAFTRSTDAATVAVVVNLSNEAQQGVEIDGIGQGTVLLGPP